VVYANTLNTNESVELLLEYFNPFGLPVVFTNLQPNEVPFVSLAPPAILGKQVDQTNIMVIPLANGDVMLEFPSFTNQAYTILYYDYGASNNVMAATPSYISPANWVQWIDYGPPKTISHPTIPTNTGRAYGVFQNP
jgi:hypothetical protein